MDAVGPAAHVVPVAQELGQRGAKSPVDSRCRHSSGSTSATFDERRTQPGQDRADGPHSLAGGRVGAPVIPPRAADLDRPGPSQGPGWGVAVADHQPPATLVDLVGVGGQVGVHLRFQGLGQHPAGAFAGQLVQSRRNSGRACSSVTTRNLRRCFLPGRWPAGVLGSQHGWKVRRVPMLESTHKIQA